MALARADLESLLRARQLDRTLTTALPAGRSARRARACADRHYCLRRAAWAAGFRAASSRSWSARDRRAAPACCCRRWRRRPRAASWWRWSTRSTCSTSSRRRRPASISTRLLWIRGHVVTNPGLCRDLNQRAIEQAIRALDARAAGREFRPGRASMSAEAPADAVRRLPFTTWLRLQRMVEGSQTACVLVGSEPMARSSAGLDAARLGIRDSGFGMRFGSGCSTVSMFRRASSARVRANRRRRVLRSATSA